MTTPDKIKILPAGYFNRKNNISTTEDTYAMYVEFSRAEEPVYDERFRMHLPLANRLPNQKAQAGNTAHGTRDAKWVNLRHFMGLVYMSPNVVTPKTRSWAS